MRSRFQERGCQPTKKIFLRQIDSRVQYQQNKCRKEKGKRIKIKEHIVKTELIDCLIMSKDLATTRHTPSVQKKERNGIKWLKPSNHKPNSSDHYVHRPVLQLATGFSLLRTLICHPLNNPRSAQAPVFTVQRFSMLHSICHIRQLPMH